MYKIDILETKLIAYYIVQGRYNVYRYTGSRYNTQFLRLDPKSLIKYTKMVAKRSDNLAK